MITKSITEEAISQLDVQSAFKLVEFYEDAAAVVKGRTWSITAWILTINSALLAFAFQLYTNHSAIHGFIWIQGGICLVGITMCAFLYLLISDQGNHLQHYWTNENKVGAWNVGIRELILGKDELSSVRALDYAAPFPKFCRRLRFLSLLFAVGFLATLILMWMLVTTL